MKNPVTTLCYIEKDDAYLMLHRVKKKNDLNEHKWVGIGGHAEEGESPEDCLLREAKEETSLTLTSWRFRGLVTFVSDQWGTEYMCLYTADGFEGELSDCDEGCLEWVAKKDIPKLNLLFPEALLRGRPARGLAAERKGYGNESFRGIFRGASR